MMDPITRFVRSLPGENYKLEEAAVLLDVSAYALRKLIADGRKSGDRRGFPSKEAPYGARVVYIYTPADITRIRALITEQRALRDFTAEGPMIGRPPQYSPAVRDKRRKLTSRAWYYRKRIEALKAEGKRKELAAAKRALKEIEDELKETQA